MAWFELKTTSSETTPVKPFSEPVYRKSFNKSISGLGPQEIAVISEQIFNIRCAKRLPRADSAEAHYGLNSIRL